MKKGGVLQVCFYKAMPIKLNCRLTVDRNRKMSRLIRANAGLKKINM